MKNLSMAYEMKKRNSKKLAKGGEIVKDTNSAKTIAANDGNKPLVDSQPADGPTVKQAQKPSLTPLSQPKIVGSDAFSVRARKQRDENNNQIDSFYPESDRAQPKARYNEEGPNRQGPAISDMQSQHNNNKAPYIKHVEDQYSEDVADDNMKKVQSPLGRYAEGGEIEDSLKSIEKGISKMSKSDGPEIHPLSWTTESEEAEQPKSVAEAIMNRKRMADGGQVDLSLNSQEQPNEYYDRNEEVLKEDYGSEIEDMSQPLDSNQHSVDLNSDEHSMISKIRSMMNKKRLG